MRIAVLGAGISGLTAARLFADSGYQVSVYEKNLTPGGLARTRFTDGYLYDPHGGHIFNSKHSEVVEWVFSILPKDKWQYRERNAKIFFEKRYISYPFELSLCELETEDAVECIYDFICSKEGSEPDNFRDWLIWNFGEGIAKRYMIPYNEKIWAYPLEKMETQWMQGKMPMPTKKELIRSMLLKDPSERKTPHSTFYYPLRGGIQSLADAIADGLDIRYGQPVLHIENFDDKWKINDQDVFDLVISTIPLPELPRIMEMPEVIAGYISQLRYNSMTTVLFECPKTDITWLYIPSHGYRSHRVGYQSTLTPFACPNPDRGCASLEIIGSDICIEEKFTDRKDILPEELGFRKVIDYEYTKYAYVVHDKLYRRNVSAIKQYFAQKSGFRLLGRWGTWNYKNMDLCMLDAMELVKEYGG